MNSHPILTFFARLPGCGFGLAPRLPFLVAAVVGLAAQEFTSAATYTWDNGVYQNATDPTLSGTYFGTGQWSNRTNWVGPGTGPAAMPPVGGPGSADDVVLNLNLDNPVAPVSNGTSSGTATNVLWFKNTTPTGTTFINSVQFTGTTPKYVFNGNPVYSSTATTALPFNVLFVASDITMGASSGPAYLAQASGTVSRNFGIRPSGTSISFVNHSTNAMTFGTPANTAFDPTTYVGGNATQTGFVFNGGTVSTGVATVVNMTTDGGGDIVFNNSVQNSTSGIRLVVNASNGGRVMTKTLQVGLNGGANPSIQINSGTLEFGGQVFTDSNFGGIAIGSGAAFVVNRPVSAGAIAAATSMTGAGMFRVDGGSEWQQTGSLNQTGGTVIASGTLTLTAVPALTGNVSIGAGSVLKPTQPTNLTIGGTISGAGRLWKGGSGTATLSGNNSFTGGIQIDSNAGAGALVMEQLNVSQLITGTVPGTLAITGGGDAAFDISPAVAGGLGFRLGSVGASDLVTSVGIIRIGSGVLEFGDFAFTPVGGFGAGEYPLFSATNLFGTLGAGTSGPIGSEYLGTLQVIGSTLQLAVTAVPEPSLTAVTSMAAAAGVLLLRRRRR